MQEGDMLVKVRKDFTGMKFGRLTVIGRAPDHVQESGRRRPMWYCKCDCGNPRILTCETSNLTSGHTHSCGCYEKERTSESHIRHTDFDIVGDMAIGYTNKGEQFFVDSCNVDKLKDHSWWLTKQKYVAGYINDKLTMIHRFLTNCDENHIVDHKNHITFDNRLSNLRVCSYSENQCNRKMQSNNSSGTIGISWSKRDNKWRAYITKSGKRIDLGRFKKYDDAVVARSEAEESYHREFSLRNSLKDGAA